MSCYVKTKWDRCACADFYSVGRGRAVEAWAGRFAAWANHWRTFTGWPPFTGCWLVCYNKETPPTAAPDNLQHWHRGRGGKRRCSPSCYLHHLQEGHFSAQSRVEFTTFVLSVSTSSNVWADTDSVHPFLLNLWLWGIFLLFIFLPGYANLVFLAFFFFFL